VDEAIERFYREWQSRAAGGAADPADLPGVSRS
jgi:hypothetical protein